MDSENPDYYSMLMQDVRFREGLSSCMNCGVCTAVCPAAEFYDYDPRRIVTTVFEADNDKIEKLLKSETIWYCGECMSCRPRCPRGNTPGYVIQALRTLSQKTGLFIHSEKGRQQLALKRTIGQNILDTGYCMTPKRIDPELHPEQGPVWQWVYDHDSEVFERLGKNYQRRGDGTVREIDQQVLDEIHKIFDITGGTEMFETIERYSEEAARMMGMDSHSEEYMNHLLTANNGNHNGH